MLEARLSVLEQVLASTPGGSISAGPPLTEEERVARAVAMEADAAAAAARAEAAAAVEAARAEAAAAVEAAMAERAAAPRDASALKPRPARRAPREASAMKPRPARRTPREASALKPRAAGRALPAMSALMSEAARCRSCSCLRRGGGWIKERDGHPLPWPPTPLQQLGTLIPCTRVECERELVEGSAPPAVTHITTMASHACALELAHMIRDLLWKSHAVDVARDGTVQGVPHEGDTQPAAVVAWRCDRVSRCKM